MSQLDNAFDLVHELVLAAEDVRVVLSKTTHPQHPVESSGALETIDSTQFGIANGQVTVGTDVRIEDHDVRRAVHGFEIVRRALNVHRRVHVLTVRFEVSALLVCRFGRNVRRVHQLVTTFEMLICFESLDKVADDRPFRVPEDQTGTDHLVCAEQVQLSTESPMVAAQRFLASFNEIRQVLFRLPGCAVDPLEHWTLLVAAPVRAGDAEQLEAANLARVLNVRSTAEIQELALFVRADRLVFGQIADQLDLVRLVGEYFKRLCS